jgi:hypothetical protein
VPAAVAPWNVTEQVPAADNVHDVELSDPPVVPASRVKVTIPVGTLDAVVASTTVAVQLEVSPVLIEPGLHATVVEVLSTGTVTVIVAETVLELVLWVVSPP